ncbi:MAG: FliI/YscN family ATPase [Armatimonadota bacterium]
MEQPSAINLSEHIRAAGQADVCRRLGRVERVVGLAVESAGPPASIGELCAIRRGADRGNTLAEVVGFRGRDVLLLPLGDMTGLEPGAQVVALGAPLRVGAGPDVLGRVLDAFGRPIDSGGPLRVEEYRPIMRPSPPPLERPRVTQRLELGIRAIDGLLTCGRGQRIGIFSASGAGKSVLLGIIARHAAVDVCVVALVGERSREVREFIERDLGPGLQRAVVVAATSDEPPLVRLKAAFTATTLAEYFRDKGHNVVLLMDSLTRVARARREVSLAVGEAPTTRGYTPSVFAMLPELVERAGNSSRGSITGVYTVLVESDDMDEPLADAARAVLDGHIVLSRRLAGEGRYPAVDLLSSVSRVMNDIVSREQVAAAGALREVLATYAENEDLVTVGAYERGTDPRLDRALDLIQPIHDFLAQARQERCSFDETLASLRRLFPEAWSGGTKAC